MGEFNRILKPGGTLLLTVPYGKPQVMAAMQQFDQVLVSHAVDAFGQHSLLAVTYYRYSVSGWKLATKEECADCEYVDYWITPNAPHPPFPRQPDNAVAARAVACIRLVKSREN